MYLQIASCQFTFFKSVQKFFKSQNIVWCLNALFIYCMLRYREYNYIYYTNIKLKTKNISDSVQFFIKSIWKKNIEFISLSLLKNNFKKSVKIGIVGIL